MYLVRQGSSKPKTDAYAQVFQVHGAASPWDFQIECLFDMIWVYRYRIKVSVHNAHPHMLHGKMVDIVTVSVRANASRTHAAVTEFTR